MKNFSIPVSITSRDSAYLDQYLSEIGKIPLLTENEEFELFQKAKEGCQKSINRIVKANLRFVISVAKQYQHKGVLLCDLINEGNIGLIRAVQKFDISLGYKFITYAVWWIRQQIITALHEKGRLVRIPQNKIVQIQKVSSVAQELEQELGRTASASEIAELLEMDVKDVRTILRVQNRKISIDEPLGDAKEAGTIIDMIPDKSLKAADYRLSETESLEYDMKDSFRKLNQRQRQILRLYYGINCIPCSLEEIGEILAITRERVRQIRDAAIVKLRLGENRQQLKRYLG